MFPKLPKSIIKVSSVIDHQRISDTTTIKPQLSLQSSFILHVEKFEAEQPFPSQFASISCS